MSDNPEQPPPPYGQTPQPGPQGPYNAYGSQGFGAPPGPTPTSATMSLVLGIVSVVCLGLLTGIPAMVIGRRATREIDASNGALGGRGVATAGFVTGLIGTLLSVLAIVAIIGLIALGRGLESQFMETCTGVAGSGTAC